MTHLPPPESLNQPEKWQWYWEAIMKRNRQSDGWPSLDVTERRSDLREREKKKKKKKKKKKWEISVENRMIWIIFECPPPFPSPFSLPSPYLPFLYVLYVCKPPCWMDHVHTTTIDEVLTFLLPSLPQYTVLRHAATKDPPTECSRIYCRMWVSGRREREGRCGSHVLPRVWKANPKLLLEADPSAGSCRARLDKNNSYWSWMQFAR